MDDVLKLGARLLIAPLFLAGVVEKLIDPAIVEGLLADHGWWQWLIWPATLLNLAGALALLSGLWPTQVALALALYCAVTSIFHWIPGDGWQMSIFIKNWAIAGGLLALAAAGPGRFVLGGR